MDIFLGRRFLFQQREREKETDCDDNRRYRHLYNYYISAKVKKKYRIIINKCKYPHSIPQQYCCFYYLKYGVKLR